MAITVLSRRLAAVLVAVGVLAGCTSTEAGRPRAEPSGTPASDTSMPSSTAGTESTDPDYPPPPREIPLDDVQPCDLWTADQLREFGVPTEPFHGSPSPNPWGGIDCTYSNGIHSDPVLDYSVSTLLDQGIAEAAATRGGSRAVVVPIEVVGFPAAQVQFPNVYVAKKCDVLIGTVAGQHLAVSVGVTPPDLSVDEACELSTATAELAMDNLLAQQ